MLVHELMVRDLVTLKPGLSVEAASHTLAKHKIKGAPVLNGDGRMLGILSGDDILAAIYSEQKNYLPEHITSLFSSGYATAEADDTNDLTVEDVMTKEVITVKQDEKVETACRAMVDHHIHRLPVVDSDGKLVGILSASDMLRAVADKVCVCQ